MVSLLGYHTYADKPEADTIIQTTSNQQPEEFNYIKEAQANFTPNDQETANKLPISGATNFVTQTLRLYEVQEGDTLSAIAEKFDLKVSTIINSNNLRGDLLRTGTKLLILHDDGLLVKSSNNTTLPDIAKRFHTNVEQLIVDNALESAEDVPELVFCYNCTLTVAASKPTDALVIKPKKEIQYGVPAEPVDAIIDSHQFPAGYCTYYVAKKMLVKFGGPAIRWLANAKAAGYATGNAPIQNAAVVTTGNSKNGHVAFVEQVKSDSIIVSEMNYEKFNYVSWREIPLNSKTIIGYIYPLISE